MRRVCAPGLNEADGQGGAAGQAGRGLRLGSAGFGYGTTWRTSAAGSVRPKTFIDDPAQQVILRPGQVSDFDDKLGPHPMDTAQNDVLRYGR